MKCKKCRKTIPDGSKFCNHCGTPTEKKKLYRRPDGLYEKVLTIDGKRVAFRARKEADVYIKIANYEEKKEKGLTFREVAEMWYDDRWEELQPTTQKSYKSIYQELLDWFGDMYIAEIKHKDVGRYIKSLPKSYARKTCSNRLTVLSRICKYAISEDIIEVNPCECITIPDCHGSRKRRAPTSDEADKVRKSIDLMYKSFPVGFYVVFTLCTGLRRGEALALTFRDIDLESRTINVGKSMYFISNDGKLKTPKTEAGIREVVLPEFLVPYLPKGKPKDYIFSNGDGKPIQESFHRDAMEYWQEETSLHLTAHQLRHGYATLLLEIGLSAKDRQALLGHADVTTTENVYTEVSERRRKAVAEQINGYLH